MHGVHVVIASAQVHMPGLRIRSEVPDDTLVALMQQGDERAYTEFVRRWQPLLTDAARRLGFSPDDADDLVADVLVEVATALGAGRDAPRSMASYLVTALRNRARNHWRNEERRRAREAAVREELETAAPGHSQSGADSLREGVREYPAPDHPRARVAWRRH
jgi:DNA-directed RNA polymerase specialized sigma24 family protein